MKEWRFRSIDAGAGVAWLVAALLAWDSSEGSDMLRPWVVVAAAVAAVATAIAWLARRFDELEAHVYTEGFRAGFQGRQVVQIPDARRND